MSGTLLPFVRQFFINELGVPYAGGTLTFYEAGTTTPAIVYSDFALAIPLANPLTLDSAGRAPAIYLGANTIKVILKDANGVTIWTQDNVPSTGLSSGGLGIGQSFLGDPTSPITATTYPVGTTYDKCQAGSAIVPIDSAHLIGTYVLGGMLLGSAGATVTCALVNLSDGSPEVPLVTIASASITGAYVESGTITFPSGGATKNYAIKTKVDTGVGSVWAVSLVRTS